MEDFGSIISEELSKTSPKKIYMFGTTGFGESGKPEEILDKYGLRESKTFR